MQTDVLVIGCGPAGIQAAIHASRKKASVIVVGKMSGSAISDTKLDNYFGTGLTSGTELLQKGKVQAEESGAVFIDENIIGASADGSVYSFTLDGGDEIVAKSVVLAMGISRLKLGLPGEKELYGKGVSYCAICDCNFYRGRRAVIVGNESEAAVSAEMMTHYASETSWVFWEDTVNPKLVQKAEAAGVNIHRSKPVSIDGADLVESITLEDGTKIPTDGAFIELGARSAVDVAMDLGVMPEVDDSIKVGRDCSTSVKGIFACGDITGKPWQLAKAVGEGCVAGTSAATYARSLE